jgi:replication factor C small subunit
MKDLWIEKYRPKTVDGYVFIDDTLRTQVDSWIGAGTIPHLLFHGGAGTGKTTLAKILIRAMEVDDYDVLYANGSKEGRKIEWVDKLISFCQTMPFGRFKIVLIDEADYMNPHSVQPAMRNLMEDFSDSVRFILTCNYPHRIIEPIHSRCQTVQIAKADHTEFTARAATILVDEGVEFDLDTLDTYIKATYPDLRKCIQMLQQHSTTGRLLGPKEGSASNSDDWKLGMVELFKAGDVRAARTLLCNQAQNEDMDTLFRWMYDNVSLFGTSLEQQDEAIKIIRNGLANVSLVADQEINLSATLIELSQL